MLFAQRGVRVSHGERWMHGRMTRSFSRKDVSVDGSDDCSGGLAPRGRVGIGILGRGGNPGS